MKLRARTRSSHRVGFALAAIEASRRSWRAFDGKLERCPDENDFRLPPFRLVTEEGPIYVNPASAGCCHQTLQAMCGLICEAVGRPRYVGDEIVVDALKAYQLDG
jgi:hypothetical protein